MELGAASSMKEGTGEGGRGIAVLGEAGRDVDQLEMGTDGADAGLGSGIARGAVDRG